MVSIGPPRGWISPMPSVTNRLWPRGVDARRYGRAHLFHLAHAADGTGARMRPRRRPTPQWTPRPSLHWTLDAITGGPAIVRNGRMDLLAANHLGRAMHSSL
jgi:hypothetical protein